MKMRSLFSPITFTLLIVADHSFSWVVPKSATKALYLNSHVDVKHLTHQALIWTGLNGLLYGSKLNPPSSSWNHAPISLTPNAIEEQCFQYAKDAQPTISSLIDTISRRKPFVCDTLGELAITDPFLNNLLDIYKKQSDEALSAATQLGIHRSDYMINSCDGNDKPLQIEFNTIASSFGCLSEKVTAFHKHLLRRNPQSHALHHLLEQSGGVQESDLRTQGADTFADHIPPNNPSVHFADALALAHRRHLARYPDSPPGTSTAILFIVQPNERNIADQRLLEARLWERHAIEVHFVTLAQVAAQGRVTARGDLVLRLDEDRGDVCATVVYFRAGYTPEDYPSQAEWVARGLIEGSMAVKCPTVGYQLAGMKRVQQRLCEEGVLEGLLGQQSEECAELRKCFAAQYSLGPLASAASEAAVANAEEDGSRWVLKPQREGGGNNLYGPELSAFLRKHRGDPILAGYVLMQRIFPKPQTTAFLREGVLQVLPSVSELGVYGVFLREGAEPPLLNSYAGYLLRTKPLGVDEGGVASGYSVLNSPLLSRKGAQGA